MRQHILRLLIVLVLAVGIGLIIYFAVRDNTPFVPTTYITNNIEANEDLNENLTTLNSKVNAKFGEDVVIYNIYNDTSCYYASLLVNKTLSKSEASDLKKLYNDYRNKVDDLMFSTNSLINYLGLQDQNAEELEGRKNKVNTDFNALNKSYYNIVVKLENLVTSKIYSGKNYNVVGSLKSVLTMLTNGYNNTRNNFSLVSDVNTKINSLIQNNSNASKDAVKFVIKFNSLDKQTLTNDFKNYFETSTVNDNLNILITFLNSEVYYEEI